MAPAECRFRRGHSFFILRLSELSGRFRFSWCPDSCGPALRIISQPSSAAKNAAPLFCLMPFRAKRAQSHFLLSRLQRPTPRVVSHFGCAARKMPLRQIVKNLLLLHRCASFVAKRCPKLHLFHLLLVGAERPFPLFLLSRLLWPSSSDHKPA